MAKWRIAAVLSLVVVLSAGCSMVDKSSNSLEIKASGTVVTETPALADFERVEASHTFDVTVTQGDSFAVTLRMDENVQKYVEVRVSGDTLVLTLKDRDGGYSFKGNVTLEAIVTMPALRGIALSGASKGAVSGFDSDAALDVRLSGASRLNGDIAAGTVDVDASGASHLTLDGTAESLVLDVSGASAAALYGFTVSGDADVEVSGASHAEVLVNGTLNAEASGASEVLYRGDAALGDVAESGASTVRADS
jgi:hypothetical protein